MKSTRILVSAVIVTLAATTCLAADADRPTAVESPGRGGGVTRPANDGRHGGGTETSGTNTGNPRAPESGAGTTGGNPRVPGPGGNAHNSGPGSGAGAP